MGKNRLEAFSDGVIAIIITIMVLELKVPHDPSLDGLLKLAPVFLSYVLSFIYVAIYWNNHHHLLHTVRQVSARILWANMHLLFWLSLTPFVTGWMGENHFKELPTATYGFVLLMSGVAYWILQQAIIKSHGEQSVLKQALGRDIKGNTAPLLYIIGIVLSLYWPVLGGALYVLVAVIWLVPDRRIERALAQQSAGSNH